MKNKKGFTLIELLVVIAILGLLLVIAVPAIMKMSARMKDRGLVSKIESIEDGAINWAQSNSNKLKAEWGEGEKCNDENSGTPWCTCEDTKTDSGYSRHFCKYVHKITVQELVELGAYSSERTDGDNSLCDVTDPTDASKCLDCAVIEIKLDDDYKTATAHLDLEAYKNFKTYPTTSCPTP